CTCRRRRQVRDLIIAYIGRTANVPCPPRQRQRGQAHGRFPAEPFSAASKSTKRKSKNHGFLAAFFPPFLSLLKEMGPPEAKGLGKRSAPVIRNFLLASGEKEYSALRRRVPRTPVKKEDHPQGGPPFYAFCRRAAFLTPS
ncbi:MAG: hypothetical protein Q3X80_06230, partial [Oscillospiraceae bacterium]|nr:hypothetical protein [Oscillospiraceae bacterium]